MDYSDSQDYDDPVSAHRTRIKGLGLNDQINTHRLIKQSFPYLSTPHDTDNGSDWQSLGRHLSGSD